MKPLQQAYIPESEMISNAEQFARRWADGDQTLRDTFPAADAATARAAIFDYFRDIRENETVLKNDTYQVNVRKVSDGCLHLSIKRCDRQPIHDWRDLQDIKNQIVGEECEAIELYPAESRRVDTANQFHLWASTDDKFRFPIGWHGQRLVTDHSIGKSVNRPLTKKEKTP